MAIRLSGMVSGLDTDSIVQALVAGQKQKKTKIEASKQKLEWKQELWSDMNKKVYDFYKSSLSKIKMQTTYKTKSVSSSDSSRITATAGANATDGTYKVKVLSTASAQYVTSGELKKDSSGNVISSSTKLADLADGGIAAGTQIKFTSKNGAETKYLDVTADTTVSDFVNAAKSAGLNASFDAAQQRFFISSADSGENQKFTISVSANVGTTTNDEILNKLGLREVTGSAVTENLSAADGGMAVVAAADSKITLNGATLKSSNSTLSANGLTINVLDADPDKEVTLTVKKDTSAVYDSIKDFISEYNSILKTMNTSYNADRAKGYDVLTDEQKESMTDDEVEKWETKIKSSLLRRDDTLNGIISSFRNNMMGSYTASDGKKYSLASLGIMTSTDYTENGLLHIKGDEDDDVYADETNKLKEMLDKDPDLVMEIMTNLTTNLYNDLTKKMSANKQLSSAFTFYNDKQMKTQLQRYEKEISNWETKLADLEERYYKQFTAMEKALAQSQSQSSSLSGFFG